MRSEYGYPRGTWTPDPQYWWPYTTPEPTYQQQWWFSCPKCGKSIKSGSLYCPHCGERFGAEETEKEKLDAILRKLDEILEVIKDK